VIFLLGISTTALPKPVIDSIIVLSYFLQS